MVTMATCETVYQFVFKIWASIAAGLEPISAKPHTNYVAPNFYRIVSLAIAKTAALPH
jgi:hypothetical protein